MTDHRTAGRWAVGGFVLGALVLLVVAVADDPDATSTHGAGAATTAPTGEAVTVHLDLDPDLDTDQADDDPPVVSGDVPPVVTVDPATDLVDHQVVTVRGAGFAPDASVSLLQCFDSDNCAFDLTEIDDDGTFTTTVGVSATGAAVDCRQPDALCALSVHVFDDAGDPLRPGGAVPLGFDPAAPLAPEPTLAAAPLTDLADGDVVTLTGDNLRPGESVGIVVCDSPEFYREVCQVGTGGVPAAVDDDGHLSAPYRATAVFDTLTGGTLDCRRQECYLQILPGLTDPTIVPVAFEPDSPLAPPPEAFVRVVEGRDLHVQGEGFLPGEEVYTGVCIKIGGERTCQAPTPHHTTADDDGAIDSTFTPAPFDGFDTVADCRAGQCSVFFEGTALSSTPTVRARFALDP